MWRRARCNQLSRSLCKSIDGSAPFGSRGATTTVTLTADRSARSIFRRTNKESGNNGKTSYISATNVTSCRGTTNAESSFSTSTSSSLSWNQSRRYWVRGTAGNNHLSSCYTSSLLQSFQLQQRRLIRQRPTNTTTTATPTQTHLRTNPKPFEQPIAETSTIAGSAATVPTTASVTTTTTTTISRVIPTFKRNVSVALGLGSLSGAATACAGLGASLILNPGLTGLLGLTQLEANATNMVALTVSALAGSGHFLSAGIVNIPVALCLSIPSIIFATVGAKYAHKFPPRALQLAFCLLLGAVVPMAVYRDYTLTKDPQKKNVSTHHNHDNAQSAPWPTTVEEWRNMLQSSMEGISTSELIKHSGMGVIMGLMSGIMGIGGAFLVAAYLSIGCQMSQQEVLGTAVFGILPPAVVSSAMHLRLGNVKTTLLPPLLVGTLAGAMGGAQLALFLPEDALRHIFTAVLAIIGCVSIRSFLRRKAK